MLSSQTKDPVTSQAVTNLHQTLPSGLTADSLAEADEATISECINKVGFWRRKTEYIQSAAKMILQGGLDKGETLPDGWQESGLADQEEIPGDIPRTLGGLCKLKGVGPKMAFLALQCAWNM
jgi:endonuclease-3